MPHAREDHVTGGGGWWVGSRGHGRGSGMAVSCIFPDSTVGPPGLPGQDLHIIQGKTMASGGCVFSHGGVGMAPTPVRH